MSTDRKIRLRDQRVAGWYWSQNELIDQFARRVGVYGIAVYTVLARHARNNEVKGLSAAQIASLLRCSRAQVFRALEELEELGVIARQPSWGRETTYVLLDLKPVKKQPVSDRDRYQTPKESPSETGVASHSDGSRRSQRLPYKEARLQDCKTILPPTPLSGGESSPLFQGLNEQAWSRVLEQLKTECASTALSTRLCDEYDGFFRDTWQVDVQQPNVIIVGAEAPEIASKGVHRYRRRLVTIGRRLFSVDLIIQVAGVDEDDQHFRSKNGAAGVVLTH